MLPKRDENHGYAIERETKIAGRVGGNKNARRRFIEPYYIENWIATATSYDTVRVPWSKTIPVNKTFIRIKSTTKT